MGSFEQASFDVSPIKALNFETASVHPRVNNAFPGDPVDVQWARWKDSKIFPL
jgi:hypothetical protein